MNSLMQKIERILATLVRFFFKKVFRMSLDEKKLVNIMQFIRFCFVGISNTMLHYFIYLVCLLIGIQYMLANFIGFTIGVANSFYWNNRYVFKDNGENKRFWLLTFLKTYISYGLTGILLNSVLLHIEVGTLGINQLIAPIANLLITIPLNFVINKFWAYKVK